jgi:hypothetical protein
MVLAAVEDHADGDHDPRQRDQHPGCSRAAAAPAVPALRRAAAVVAAGLGQGA